MAKSAICKAVPPTLISPMSLIKAPVNGLICTRSDVGELGRGGGNPGLPLIVLPNKISLVKKAKPLSLDTPAGCPTGETAPVVWSIISSQPLLIDRGEPSGLG